MAETRQRIKIDVEDILQLAVELGPEEAKNKILDIYNKIDTVYNGLEGIFDNPTINGFQDLLNKFDSALGVLNELTGGSLASVAKGLSFFRNLASIIENGKLNLNNCIAFFTSFFPSNVKSVLSEAAGYFGTFMGIVQYLKNTSPDQIVKDVVKYFIGSALNKLLPAPFKGMFGNLLGGSTIGDLLAGFSGGGGILGSVLGAAFGSLPSTASVKVMDTLPGGFEDPDGIMLSEKHIRFQEKQEEAQEEGSSTQQSEGDSQLPPTEVEGL